MKKLLLIIVFVLATNIGYAQDAWGEWADLTMTLYIQDSQGNTSEKVTFTTALSRGIKQASPPALFDISGLKALGHIWVQLPRIPRGGA